MKQYIIVSLIAIWVFSACSEEDDAVFTPPDKQCNSTLYASLLPADTCLDFPDLWGTTYFYYRVGPGYALIGKTPNNPDEWIYLINREEVPTSNEGSEIWKVDTCSGRKQFILDKVKSQPKVSKQGWMIFRRTYDGLMYRANLQGDSLKAVSNLVAHDLFDWCLDGEAFFYRARFKDVAYLVDINGNVLDSFALDCHAIAGRGNRIALSLDSEVSVNHSRIAVLNLFTGSLTEVTETGGMGIGGPLALAWESDDTLIGAFGRAGLFRIHISTGEVEPIKETCENVFYYYPVVDLDNPSWLILGKRDYYWPDSLSRVYFTADMVLYNTETGEEWKLDLDQ
ncbi:MAG: hypothetical protein KDD19_23440 [Phaeodactylibacter sp.]|nr:hypothetical protein [Phaeodactylibacter sp.]MCB9052949.1 hypothetical protein [Lewinellaceae bacterium]